MRPKSLNTKFQFVPFVISLAITLAIGFVASIFTRPQIATWYLTLKKPSFNPPDFAFPIAWTILYILIAIAAYIVWKKRNRAITYKATATIYFIQLLLNFSWSIIFFGMHQIFGGLAIITFLWISIIFNIGWFGKFSKTAAWLLVPYLLWVSFAWLLNLNIYLLNR
ncbi:TspO/MBR family protein [Mucilaginibacter sp.]